MGSDSTYYKKVMLFDIQKAVIIGRIRSQRAQLNSNNADEVFDAIIKLVQSMKDESQLQADYDEAETSDPRSWSNLLPDEDWHTKINIVY